MATYAKRTCSDCGIRLPQPNMLQLQVSQRGVNGNWLAPRDKWFCLSCVTKRGALQQNLWQESKLRAEKEHHAKKKQEWALEQEKRRQQNILKK